MRKGHLGGKGDQTGVGRSNQPLQNFVEIHHEVGISLNDLTARLESLTTATAFTPQSDLAKPPVTCIRPFVMVEPGYAAGGSSLIFLQTSPLFHHISS